MKRAQNPMRRSWLDETDGGWIPHRLRLLMSPAWRHRPRPLCRILERIEIEHMRHGGKENGHLCVTYDQFVEYGVSKRAVRGAIEAGEKLGLLEIRQPGGWIGNIRAPNEYRLTYVPEKDRRAPTDEWASITDQEAEKITADFQRTLSAKTDSQCPNLQPSSSHSCTEGAPSSSHSRKPLVPNGELSLISGGNAVAGTVAAKAAGRR